MTTHPNRSKRPDAAGANQRGVEVALDTLPASLDCLPAIADRLGGAVPILFDGGIRRGTDVLKALALGADFVWIGRPFLYGAVVAGEAGVARAISLLHAEIDRDRARADACARVSTAGWRRR